MDKIKLGKFGEQIASDYLKNKGFKIIQANYYTRFGEIDLIASKERVIHFVEVKTRTNQNFGWPEEAVTKDKLEKLAGAAEKYLQTAEQESNWQIDVISLIINKNKKIIKIRHLENII